MRATKMRRSYVTHTLGNQDKNSEDECLLTEMGYDETDQCNGSESPWLNEASFEIYEKGAM